MELITIQEATIIAQRSKQTIYAWIEKGILTKYKEGFSTRIDKAELEAFLKPKKG